MRKVLLFVATLLLVWSCGKDETSELIPENEFFKVQPDNLDVKIFYDYLKNGNTEEIKSKTDVDIWGIPIWDKEVKYISNNKTMYLIPYVEPDKMEINSILVLGVDPLELQYGMYINDQDYYPTPDFDWVFEYFMQEIFEKSDKYEFIPVNNIEDTNTKAAKLTCNDVYSYAGGYRHYIGRDCFYTIIPNVPFALTDRDGGDGEYGGSFSNPGGGSPSPSPAPPVKTTQKFDKSIAGCLYKAMRVQDRLLPETLLNELLRGFEFNDSKAMIKYDLTESLGATKYGICTPVNLTVDKNKNLTSGQFNITISIDNMKSTSFLWTANTIMHETIHAHLFCLVYDANTHRIGNEIDFKNTYDALKVKYGRETQHEIMLNYISVMKKNLHELYKAWDDKEEKSKFIKQMNEVLPNRNLDFVFEVMARGGLKRTSDGSKFYSENKADYDMVTSYLDDCLPTPCPL
ncbi:hypothetical protein [Marinifilum flexuosum]|uniref:Uncharacterized protein n=1 Tax=Marinifilum flexuosum TaxID=1117708 RepID=A0A419X797_9BACT|nr:hypothetical protein [Marinifilum flexuosum]RKE03565.1 hypothetical protein BXY64_0571 [Marinifilum flexuosum]